jgi:feruloyl esterase
MAVVVGLGFIPGQALANASPVIRPVRQCPELVQSFEIPGAITHVTSATPVPGDTGPAYCDLRGFVEPAVHFQLRLPTSTYTGRYVQYGCQGLCGVFSPTPFPDCGPRGGDLAVAATDDGHDGLGDSPFLKIVDGSWGANNQAARNDFFYRAPHVVALATKRIIAAYYGAPPTHSYFNGCSTGGREGLLLAQRYPYDFDGIVAGSPANFNAPLMGIYFAWMARTNNDPSGAPIMTSAKLPALHNAVVTACDGLDGLVDGQIDDPRACRYDPSALQCPPGTDLPTCLTPAQVASVGRLYNGPADSAGRRLYPGWESRGSELAWENAIIPGAFGSIATLADNFVRHLAHPIGAPQSSLADVQFTVQELNRLTAEGIKGNALSLDYRAFRRAGGKLIIWHGWDDQSIPAVGTLDYYQRLWQRNGGLRETQQWARLFMVPTVYHCAFGGYRLNEFDPFSALVGWVEHGNAPDRIVANQRDAQLNVIRSRPVFPYPLRVEYDGTGSIDAASNFVPAQPSAPLHDIISWAGEDLYNRSGPVAR